jgi:hypothetical protein
MSKVRTWAGLNVHAAEVVACVVDAQSGEMTVHRLPGTTNELVASAPGCPARRAWRTRQGRPGSGSHGR